MRMPGQHQTKSLKQKNSIGQADATEHDGKTAIYLIALFHASSKRPLFAPDQTKS